MIRAAGPLALLMIGLLLFGQGAYIHAKALVAQILLRHAFEQTVVKCLRVDAG